MKFEDLIAKIKEEQANYSLNESEKTLYDCIQKNKIRRVADLFDIDIWTFIKCFIYADSDRKYSMEQSGEIIAKFQQFVAGKSTEEIRKFYKIIQKSLLVAKKEGYDSIKTILSKCGFKEEPEKIIIAIMKFYEERQETCNFAVVTLLSRLDMEDYSKLPENINKPKESIKKGIQKEFADVESIILELQNTIQNDINNQDIQKKIDTYNRYTKLLEDLYEKKQSNQYIPVADARIIIKGKLSDTIKLMVLNWIDEYNTAYNEELQRMVDQVKANQNEASEETVNYILSKLGYLKIKEKPQQEILQNTTKEIVDAVMWYNSNGYISQAAIAANPSIFYIGDKKLERMARQIEEINELGLNPKIFMDAPEYFWDECESFISNLKFLVDYSLQGNLSDCENFSFLLEENLVEKIDLLIELGYYEHLKENLELLNYSLETMKGLELLKQINPINSMDELIDALESQSFIKFIINNGKLDDYIIDYASFFKNEHTDLGDEALKQIIRGKNMDQPVVCEIGGSIFSLPKIDRRLQEGDNLWEAMFYGKRVTEDEYQEVMKALLPKTK